jgi:hypothetical protein
MENNSELRPGRPVILNLGLNPSKLYAHQNQGVSLRAKIYHAVMHDIMCHPYEVYTVLPCVSDASREATLVVRGTLAPNASLRTIKAMCQAALQDCIAVFYPDTEDGTLIGPHANDFGTFDIRLFKGAHL